MSDDRDKRSPRSMTSPLATLKGSMKTSHPRVPSIGKPVVDDAPPPAVKTANEQTITGKPPRIDPGADDGGTMMGTPPPIDSGDDVGRFASVQGTPLYMSPEQCRNDVQTAQTDVYALGVMMFELLEGAPPFVAESVVDVLTKHLDEPVPEQRSKFTPAPVKLLVARMLSKEPNERPEMTEVIALLQEHVLIGVVDVLGLEEESWSVSEIEENTPEQDLGEAAGSGLPLPIVEPEEAAFFNPPQQTTSRVDATMDIDEFEIVEDDRKPIWILAVLGVLLFGVMFALFYVSGDDDETGSAFAETPVVESAPEVAEEPAVDEPVAAAPDAGELAAEEPDLGAASPQIVEVEPPEPAVEPEPKPKPRKKRAKKKPKPKLQELRL